MYFQRSSRIKIYYGVKDMHSEGKDQEACPCLQELLQGHISQQGGPSHVEAPRLSGKARPVPG